MDDKYISRINDYLFYGYAPNDIELEWLNLIEVTEAEEKLHYSSSEVAQVLDSCIDDLLPEQVSKCVIPLSGGWDSRVLFGAAMERYDRSRLVAVSFGSPGLLDYDIGQSIAKKFAVPHFAVDLRKITFVWEELLASVLESPWTYVPDGYFNRFALSQVVESDQDIILTGFMGDPLTGGHPSKATNRVESIKEFISSQRRERSILLSESEYDPRYALPELPEGSAISDYDLLDFGIRQSSCIASIVTPQSRWQNWGGDMGYTKRNKAKVFAPFVHPKWASYWMRVPKRLKYRQRLYREMLAFKFPELANMPSEYSLGTSSAVSYFLMKNSVRVRNLLGAMFPKSKLAYRGNLNYIDYAEAFRSREDYIHVLDKAIKYLSEFEIVPWLQLEKLKADHLNRAGNYENALLVLIGLALNLEAEQLSKQTEMI